MDYPAGGIPGSRGAGERGGARRRHSIHGGGVASGYNFQAASGYNFEGGRGDTCFGVAKIQGYVNFACYKTTRGGGTMRGFWRERYRGVYILHGYRAKMKEREKREKERHKSAFKTARGFELRSSIYYQLY